MNLYAIAAIRLETIFHAVGKVLERGYNLFIYIRGNTSYPGYQFQNAGVVRHNAALRISLVFYILSVCFNHCLVLCPYTIYKLSNSLIGY
jgi:hypothetical protein